MSFISYHFQDEVDNWNNWVALAAQAGSPLRVVKFFQTEPYNIVKAISPTTRYIFRQWADDVNQDAWLVQAGQSEAGADAAADQFILSFKDSVNQHMGTDFNGMKYVESINEQYPTGNVEKLRQAVEFDRGFIRRLPVHCPGVTPAVFTAAIGNPNHNEYQYLIPLAADSHNGKALWCYHAYWTVYEGYSYLFDQPQARDLHMRWNEIDLYMRSRGYNLTWALTETGADLSTSGDGYNPGVLDGWKHDKVWNGNIDAYVADIANFDSLLASTVAAQEGRFLGVTLFTSKINPSQWSDFNLIHGDGERVAQYIAANPTPTPVPPTPDPDPDPPDPPDPPVPPGVDIDLRNGSFEDGWYDASGTQQIPLDWVAVFADESVPNPYDSNDWAVFGSPETRVLNAPFLPPDEVPLYIIDGEYTFHIFRGIGNSSWYGQMSQPLNLAPGENKVIIKVFGDLVMNYLPDGTKVWADDPLAGQFRFLVAGVEGEWKNVVPGQWNEFELIFNSSGGEEVISIEIMCPFPLVNNGVWCDDWSLEVIEIEQPPEDNYRGVFHLLPQDATIDEKDYVTRETHTDKTTYGQSADDAVRLVAPGLSGSKVVVWAADRWADDIGAWLLDKGVELIEFEEFPVVEVPEIINIIDELPQDPDSDYATRSLDDITALTIHHTTGAPFQPIANIASYHVNTKHWPGIGYTFVIDGAGVIHQTNYLTTKSFHAGSFNAPGDENLWSVGIALQGHFGPGTDDFVKSYYGDEPMTAAYLNSWTAAPPPQAQQDAAKALVVYLKEFLPNLPNDNDGYGHRQMPGASTACPGSTFEEWLPYVLGS